MNTTRIYGMVLRHFYNLRRSFDRLSDVFYWPVLDIIIWGLTGFYFVSFAPNSGLYIAAIIGSVLLWIIPWRAQNEISINVLVELWDRNMAHIFVSPFKFSEWVTSLIIVGILKGLISLVFASFVAFFLYKVNILMYGFYLLPLIFLLFMFGWSIGFLVASVVLRFGSRIQTLAWTVPWAAAPFSAIYFPVSILPRWGQIIAKALPSSYVYELGRELVFKHTFSWNYFFIGLLLDLAYFITALFIFKWSFKKAMERGLQSIN